MDPAVLQYLTTALWSSTNPDDDDAPMDRDFTIADFTPDAIAQAETDCATFAERAGDMLAEHDDPTRWAHDFWLTRNGHGAGFWDGDWPARGDALTKLAESFGEIDIYVGDMGRLHFY